MEAIIYSKGAVIVISFLILIFVPLSKFFGDEENLKLNLFIIILIGTLLGTNPQNFLDILINKVSHLQLFFEIIFVITVTWLINYDIRAKALSWLIWYWLLQIIVCHKSLFGIILNPEPKDLIVLFVLNTFYWQMVKYNAYEKVDKHF